MISSPTAVLPEIKSASTDGEQVLRQHTHVFIKAWRTSLKQWQPDRASALYEELERLATIAEEQGAAAIAESALELAVYLCSFVDCDTAPNPAQRQGLERLIDRLAAAVGENSGGRMQSNARAVNAEHRQVFYLGSEAREVPGLAAQLGQQRCIVRPFRDPARLLLALDEVSPDVLLVDEAFVDCVHPLVAAVQRRRPAHRDPLLCLVLAEETDDARALFAQRAGADAVVTERDCIALAARLDTQLAQRRAWGYRVLIVEDDRGQAKFCESILHHRGVITSVCEDPTRVFEVLADFKPELVLLDLYLPGSNGIEIAQRIREQPTHAFLPIVFLSGEQDLDLHFDAIRVGADDFITKPVKPGHLITTVESRIKRARDLRVGQPESRGERRRILSSRDVLVREILRTAHEQPEQCSALALIAVDRIDELMRGIGFVDAGILPQQVAAAFAAELCGSRTLCAWGELRFLALLHAGDEITLREQLEAVRCKLEAREWLSDKSSLRLHFSLGCVRLPAELAQVEKLLERVRALCAHAQDAGGARSEFDLHIAGADSSGNSQRRLVRALLRAVSIRGAAHFEFQPIVPLSGQLAGQYEARMELKAPNSPQILRLARAEYLPIVRELGMVAHADRHLLRGVLNLVRERNVSGQELRLHVPIAVATVLDPAFAPWLIAELRAHEVPSSLIALQLAASEVRGGLARLRDALTTLQRVGVRLVLEVRDLRDGAIDPLLEVEDFSIVKFARASEELNPDAAWEPWSHVVAAARTLGKITVACDVAGVADLGVLVRLGVHYAQGDSLSGWLSDWNFDFVESTTR